MTIIDWRELLLLRILRFARMFHLNRIVQFSGPAHPFTEYFKGFEKVETVRRIFGEKTEAVLRNQKVEFMWFRGYMWVNNTNGHIVVSSYYLNNGDKVDIHLDVVHELTHVKQFMEGKELFNDEYSYAERPTEVEAYRFAVEEARRLGLSEERICEYLKTEWMNDEDLRKLARSVGVNCSKK